MSTAAASITSVRALVRQAQWRMALFSLACVGLSMAAVGLLALRDYENRSMELVARSLAFAGEPALRFNDKAAMRELIEQVAASAQLAEVTIDAVATPGWLHYESPAEGAADAAARSIEHALMGAPAGASIGSEGEALGTLSLRSDGRSLMRFVLWALIVLGLSAIASVIAVAAYSRLLAASIVRPIDVLAGLTRQVRESRSFTRRAGRAGVREIDALAADFNAMLSELELQQSVIESHHTDLRAANVSLQKASRHDSLTELPNRAYLGEHLDSVIERCRNESQEAGLIFVDTDRFKEVNDKYGHSAGDLLLVELSRRLRESIRDTDFVARIGGDEFVIVIHPLGEAKEIARLTDRICTSLDRPLTLPGGALRRISVTMGVALFPAHADTAEALVKAADEAMYRAKSAGRGTVATFRPASTSVPDELSRPWARSTT